MKQLVLLVEGQTEEQFAKKVLAPFWSARGLFVRPVLLSTKKGPQHRAHKGGMPSRDVVRSECLRLLGQSLWDGVGLLLDYYGLHHTFGKAEIEVADPHERARQLRERFEEEIRNETGETSHPSRFRFFLLIHEFEALLFADPEKVTAHFATEKALSRLEDILKKCNGDPELINDAPTTAPSKRLQQVFPKYRKVSDGVRIAQSIGLEGMRKRCRAFNEFCHWLDELATTSHSTSPA